MTDGTYLCSLSDVEKVTTKYLVLRWLAPGVPRSPLDGNGKARAAPIIACANNLNSSIIVVRWVARRYS